MKRLGRFSQGGNFRVHIDDFERTERRCAGKHISFFMYKKMGCAAMNGTPHLSLKLTCILLRT